MEALQSSGTSLGGTTGRSLDLWYPKLCFSSFNCIFRGIGGFPFQSRHLERGNIFLGDM